MKSLQFLKFPELTYAVTEAINTLCTNLTFTGSKYKKIMITSVSEAEGKSFLSMEIMRTMSELGKRVVLVDADLRRSNITTKYDVRYNSNNNLGITHYLAGKCQLEDILYSTDYKRAFFVPVGYCVSNSLALLNSPKLQELLEQLAMQADYVLIDSPPAGLIVDASEIAKSCDGAIFAVSYNNVHRRDLFDARQQIERSGCAVLGAVLNDVPMNVYSKRKYLGTYSKYSYTHVPVKNPHINKPTNEEKVINAMIDIHHHLLYGLDDGPADVETMQQMLKVASGEGVHTLIATPHIAPGIKPFPLDVSYVRLSEAQNICDTLALDIHVLPGAEILYTHQTARYLTEGRIPTLGGTNKVLIEFQENVTLRDD